MDLISSHYRFTSTSRAILCMGIYANMKRDEALICIVQLTSSKEDSNKSISFTVYFLLHR